MTENGDASEDLAAEIADVYGEPLDTFVARRDALAKRLRAAGRREDAKMVKALRKPKRLAWALNVASREDPKVLEAVAVAIAAAQSGTADFRAALRTVRAAAQDFAAAASRVAERDGHAFDHGELSNAVMAVIGTQHAFALLRAGRLVDVPEAGGLDLLAGPAQASVAAGPAGASASAVDTSAETDAAREALRQAEHLLEAARERLTAAERTLGAAEAKAESANRALLVAQREADARRAEADRARDEARKAAEHARDAEEALANARQSAGGD